MERSKVDKAKEIFCILEPTLLNKYCRPHGKNGLAVVGFDSLKTDEADSLRQLLNEDLPYLSYIKVPSVRTKYSTNASQLISDIELVVWNYKKLVELAVTQTLVKSMALQGLRLYIQQHPLRAKVIDPDLQVVFSYDEPFFRWVLLLAFLDSKLTLYLTDKKFAALHIKQTMLQKRVRSDSERLAVLRAMADEKNK